MSAPAPARRDPVRAIADAVLYEGYILWPYRRSALKNQRRFQFGCVFPTAHARAHPDDRDSLCTEVLLRAGAQARVEISVRFLQLVARTAMRADGGRLQEVDELEVGDQRVLSWEEAAEREVGLGALPLDSLLAGVAVPIAISAGQAQEAVRDAGGKRAGAIARTWAQLSGRVDVAAAQLRPGLARISVSVANTTPFPGGDREAALRASFCSTHTTLRASGASFVSLTDPPADLAPAAATCRNVGTWPVLVGDPGTSDTVLSSPIILEDHPRIAPQSPGDLFDGGEIDQLLILNILALTDEEKAEMAASDPRARQILQRTEALTSEQLMALHGIVREVRSMR
jgi:hypothetical protein